MRSLLSLFLALSFFASATATADAQRGKLGKEKYSDSHNGFEVRLLDGFEVIPTRASEADFRGTIMQSNGRAMTINIGNQATQIEPSMNIYRFDHPDEELDDEEEEEPFSIGALLRVRKSAGLKTLKKERKKIRGIPVVHEMFEFSFMGGDFKLVADSWTFDMGDYDIVITFQLPEQHLNKWAKAFSSAAKSFKEIERTERLELRDKRDYDQFLAYHQDEVSRTPGWELIETKSKRFIVKTSLTDHDFIKKLLNRLELSRDLFERDFPPKDPIEAVSVVRICATLDEFHSYGKTGRGVAGWFNPRSEELVLVDFKNYDRNITYGVMSHEAFHQYCHFLFDMSEAHRWFDEGHGDYYGAVEFKGKKAIPRVRMKGFQRLELAREQAREESFTPFSDHVRQDHRSWQSGGVHSYAQSWSLIYFLRQGMIGKVPKSLWREEYEDILPNYMEFLYKGYQEAYAKIRAERAEEAEEKGETTGVAASEISRFDLDEEQRDKIWEDAIAASWGQIEEFDPELEEFTQRWTTFVLKHMRD